MYGRLGGGSVAGWWKRGDYPKNLSFGDYSVALDSGWIQPGFLEEGSIKVQLAPVKKDGSDIERIQVSAGPGIQENEYGDPHGIVWERIWLEP
jgi:hypothetical protein